MTASLPNQLWDYCPPWCAEESDNDGGLRTPAGLHSSQHSSAPWSPGWHAGVEGGRIFLTLKSVCVHGERPGMVSDRDREPWVEVTIDDGGALLTLSPSDLRTFAAVATHVADVAQDVQSLGGGRP